jgi:hypothetical protein
MKHTVSAFVALACMVGSGRADDCDPRHFTFQDVERVNFSESLKIAVVDSMESKKEEEKGTSFSSSFLVKGSPVKLNYGDMKKVADYIKSNSSFNFPETNNSTTFARMPVSLVHRCIRRAWIGERKISTSKFQKKHTHRTSSS